jgi:hypothetical protein
MHNMRCCHVQLPLLLTWFAHALPPHCRCRYAFFDTDNVIEMAHPGESVSDIFKKYGEDYFRNCESQVHLHMQGSTVFAPFPARLLLLSLSAAPHCDM